MTAKAIDSVAIPVSDQNLALSFYRDVLGFTLLRDEVFQTVRQIALAPKDGQTVVSLVTEFHALAAGCVQGLVFKTDNIDQVWCHLLGKGVTISRISRVDIGRYATFSDPDGNGWVVVESGISPRRSSLYAE